LGFTNESGANLDNALLVQDPEVNKWIKVAFSLEKSLKLQSYEEEFKV